MVKLTSLGINYSRNVLDILACADWEVYSVGSYYHEEETLGGLFFFSLPPLLLHLSIIIIIISISFNTSYVLSPFSLFQYCSSTFRYISLGTSYSIIPQGLVYILRK